MTPPKRLIGKAKTSFVLTDNWARRTHKLYDPKWQAPASAKLALEVRSEQSNKLVLGLDGFAAEVQLKGGPDWHRVVLSPAEFHNAGGVALSAWKGVRELRLGAKETLRAKDGKQDKKLELGADWQGANPKFRNLRWVQ